jgi:hypothetical protein
MTWQPIETAPKDGEDILLFEKWGKPFIGYWCVDGWRPDTSALGIDGDATFRSDITQDFVTNWMPLPPPPEEKPNE